nr:MAG TPA: DpsA protein [Caudoviricetes sp.]
MKKRKLSISTAKFVVESAESLEATQQFSVVTEFKAGDNVVPAGKLVTIDNIKDNVIEFHTNDNVDVKLSAPESVFVVNTQLMSNEMLNESIDGKQFAEKFDKFDDKQKQVSIDLLDLSEKPSADEIAKAFDAATTDTQESLCKQVGIVDESIEDDAKSWYDNMSAEERAAAIDGLGHWSEKKFDELSADTQRAIVENFKAKDDLDESIEFVNKAPYAIDGTNIKPGDAVKVEVVADGALAAAGEQVRIKVSAGEESTELIVNKNDKQWVANVVDEAFDVSSVDASSLASMLLQSITEAHRIHLNNEFGPHVNKYAAHKILDDFYKGFPELVDSFVEQLRYDGVTLTRSDYSWSDALIGMKELIAAIDAVYDTVDSASKSELDAIKSFLKKHAWMLENQAGFVAGKVVVESWEDNYNDKSDMDKLSAIKVALMSDNLDYDAEYIKSLPVKDWPDEVKDAVQLVCESELQDAYRNFFKAKLAEYGVASPAELDAEQKSKFFSEIKKEWPDAKEELDLDEAAECPIKKANIFALSKAYTAEQNNETLAKIEELFAEAGVQGGLMFDKSAEQLDDANFAKLAKLLNVDLVTESIVTKKPVRKRSFLMAQKFINENLEAGQNLTTTATLTTVDGYAIPANEQIALTSIDSNTNLAYVTYGENSYAVTYGDLIAAIDTSVA